ncbi:MSHA pilin protein MshA [Shewanella sairae]|uniref:MSHA pilin protein MshA n=1 Tax=Shewanella sairae TaxID=190310 RepID=A0ABQ4P0K1_9GAMM|nr:type II secretion system protein [Shewanella sairae]MCL1129572.1 type II secretion system GspH family protein [Shewanella sairae]GIU41031.1 MSHA pilin protein MshA [Shewanella sairae]
MQKQNGFTLIELVVVIIILGILAVTAAPKFINLQTDARQSALQGVKGAIQGANGLVFAKAALAGEERADAAAGTDVTIIGVDGSGTEVKVKTIYGYLIAKEADFSKAMDVNFALSTADAATQAAADWIIEESGTTAIIHQVGAPNDSNTCQLTYTQATATDIPQYEISGEGC